jgi:hypothetical protein
MSDYYRLKTLDSLRNAGVYVNDYPGLIFNKKDISYFFLTFPVAEKKKPDKILDELLGLIIRYNAENSLTGSEKELRIFYLDDQGYCLLGRVEDSVSPLVFSTGQEELPAERIVQVTLTRLFIAEGIDGPYEIRSSEVKDVYEGLQKFISVYTYGWLGLFRQYSAVKERTQVFRQFKPFKFPFIGSRESLKNTVFRLQFGVRTPDGDEGFKWVSTKYGGYSLQDAVAVK